MNVQINSDKVLVEDGVATLYGVDINDIVPQFGVEELLTALEKEVGLGIITDFVTQRMNENK